MNEYMKMAVNEARKGIKANEGGPFGSVIVKNGKIIGKGHNEVIKQKDPTCHGEMMAIREACRNTGSYDLTGCEIYTTGEPCPMCLGAILWSNISKVYYGCDIHDTEKIGFRDEKFYEITSKKDNAFTEQIDHKECLELYDEYKNMSNKEIY